MNNEAHSKPVITAPTAYTPVLPQERQSQELATLKSPDNPSPGSAQTPVIPSETSVALAIAPGATTKTRVRNGKIARLPKLERDLVNRMLRNNIPYPDIVAALDEFEIKVTTRNISNWKTRGGYKQWCVEQEQQLRLSILQDNLTDYLRKNDATQLPEVGLQVAATHLSHLLLQVDTARELTADPKKYSEVVDMLCRLSTQIAKLQKDRDEAVKKARIRGTAEHLKREDEKAIENMRLAYSSDMGESARDPIIRHRNELPMRDQLPFQEPPAETPSVYELHQYMLKKLGRGINGLPEV